MSETSKIINITVPKKMHQRIRTEAKKRNTTVSSLLRESFETYTQIPKVLYSDAELKDLLGRDKLSSTERKRLDHLLV